MNYQVRFIFFACLIFMFAASMSSAELYIFDLEVPVTEDFDDFRGAGFAFPPAAGQLSSLNWIVLGLSEGDMEFYGTYDDGDYARGESAGGVTSGGIYGFYTDADTTNYTLGVQPTGSDWTPGSFVLQVPIETMETVGEIEISYNIWLLNNGGRANSFNFSYSTNNMDYTYVGDLDYTSPDSADGEPAWQSINRSTTIAGLSLNFNDYIYFRWDSYDESGSGSRDEFGLDDVTITAYEGNASGPIIRIEPTALDFGVVDVGDYAGGSIRVYNDGDQLLGLTSIMSSGDVMDFSIYYGSPFLVEPGGWNDIGVDFMPTEAGPRNMTLTLGNNSINNPYLDIPMTGVGRPTTITSIADIQADPDSYEEEYVTVEGIVTAGSGLLHGSQTKVYIQDDSERGILLFDFDLLYPNNLTRGREVEFVGQVTEFSSGGCSITELTNFALSYSGYRINPEPDPLILSTGEAGDVAALQYEGTLVQSSGVVTDISGTEDVNITIDDGSGTTVFRVWSTTGIDLTALEVGQDVIFRGIASCYSGTPQYLPVYQDHIEIEQEDVPIIQVDPIGLDFGPVTVGESDTLTLTINNIGIDTLEISMFVIDNPVFYAQETEIDPVWFIEPGNSYEMEVSFTPSAEDSYTGILTITSNADNDSTFEVALSGQGVPPAGPANIVINEIMQNPAAVADNDGEWFELYNSGESPANLEGWHISDNYSDEHVIEGSLIIQPGGYLVLATNGDTATNGGLNVDYEYDSITLGNSYDAIILTDNLGNEIDRVEYDNGLTFPDPAGVSMELRNWNFDNNIGAFWGEATLPYGDGDLGTPGAENSIYSEPVGAIIVADPPELNFATVSVDSYATMSIAVTNLGDTSLDITEVTIDDASGAFTTDVSTPATLGVGATITFDVTFSPPTSGAFEAILTIFNTSVNDTSLTNNLVGYGASADLPSIVINEIMQNPAAVGDNEGEWFELFNTSDIEVDLSGWTIRDDGSDSHVITGLMIDGGEYLVLGRSTDISINGGVLVAYAYGDDISLANGDDELILLNSAGLEVDRVMYDGGDNFPDPDGASMELIDPWLDNLLGINWVEADSAWGEDTDLGTPGCPNIVGCEISYDPEISVAPMVLDFAAVIVDSAAELSVTISNTGGADLVVSNLSTDNPVFDVPIDEMPTVAPGENYSVPVIFTPTAEEIYSGTLTIGSNAVNDSIVEVTLTGEGFVPQPPPMIVINEIMYNPPGEIGNDELFEYVELYNNDDETVDLSGWEFKDNSDSHIFVIPDSSLLAPAAYLVIARNADSLAAYYGITNVIGNSSVALNNGGDQCRIFDSDGALVDFVDFADELPWPTEADGEGSSLELIDPNLDNELAESWQASNFGGSPGVPNPPPIDTYLISGNVIYCLDDSAIVDVELTLDGRTTISDSMGDFIFTELPSDNYTLTASKESPPASSEAISAYDAAWIAQYAAELRNFTDCQIQAGDVTGNGETTAYDAARVAQYAAEIDQPSQAGNWTFEPESYDYTPLESDQWNQDFSALLYGEVTGNWSAIQAAANQKGPISIVQDDAKAKIELSVTGNSIMLPITISGASDVVAFKATVTYDDKVYEFTNARTASTLSDGYSIVTTNQNGKVTIVAYGLYAMKSEGTLINIEFQAIKEITEGASFNLTDLVLNESRPLISKNEATLTPEVLAPTAYRLHQNQPNPFNPITVISYDLPRTSKVSLTVYDVSGKLIKTLVRAEEQSAATYSVEWNGTDVDNKQVASGVYIYRLETSDKQIIKRMTLLK